MKRFLVYSAVVVALVALTGPAAAQYSTGSSNTTNTTDQNATTPSTSTPATTTPPSTETQSTTDQSTTSSTSTTTDNNMPSTASPLPLIAMSGFLTLLAGVWVSRRRRSA